MTQDHQETPHTAAHELHAHLTACSGGLSPDYTCAIPVHVCEAEAARQESELRAALRHTLTHAQFRDCFLCVQSAALLAGDKAEAPRHE